MRVFLSHCSVDKPGVQALAEALRALGFFPWLDLWEIDAGQDIVSRISQGLEQADAALVVFSKASAASAWMGAEVNYLIWAHIQHGKLVIPVLVEADAPVPPLLRPLAWCALDQHEQIAAALRAPVVDAPLPRGAYDSVAVRLRPGEGGALAVEVQMAGRLYGEAVHGALPRGLSDAWDTYRRGLEEGVVRQDSAEARVRALDSALVRLGVELRALCLPGESGVALCALLDGCPAGRWVEVVFEAEGAALMALPFEALSLADGRPLALHPSAVTVRRPLDLVAEPSLSAALAGPLKILVAVAAPDEGKSTGGVLDLERELQVILDAVASTRREHEGQVRFLEIGHPREIERALCGDAYHVLHLSCHGTPGALLLEDEDGNELRTEAAELIAPLKRAHRALPLILLNTCHGGTAPAEASSLAESLLRAGVPAVLAMTASVSDVYATALAQSFYEELQRRQYRPGLALTAARCALEQQRLQAQARGQVSAGPEYATASLFLAASERPLLDPNLAPCPLQQTPVHRVAGPVPQLGLGDLIGRRAELRKCLRLLNAPGARKTGLVLTGIGGIGKSTLAGRIMTRQREKGWHLVTQIGRWNLANLCDKVAAALEDHGPALSLVAKLRATELKDDRRQELLHQAVSQFALLVVLDDFEQNLDHEGQFLDMDCAEQLQALAQNAGAARLLLTSRPFPQGCAAYFDDQALGGLSLAESGKLITRLPRLNAHDASELVQIQALIGGHPRLLELLDALLNDGEGRLPAVTIKLQKLLKAQGLDTAKKDLNEALQTTIRLGLRDIFLENLLTLAETNGDGQALYQVAVSRLPVTAAGLARMLSSEEAETAGDEAAAQATLARLARLTLLQRGNSGAAWVQRWTAQGLAELQPQRYRICCLRAAQYRIWCFNNESHALEDVVETMRNCLDGQDYDLASILVTQYFEILTAQQQTQGIAALAAEVLETLPQDHENFAVIADAEAKAHLALGQANKALHRYEELLLRQQELLRQQPERSDYQREFSMTYEKMGDLYLELGRGEDATEAFAKSLAIREQLAQSEPSRADYQRELSGSYFKLGNLYSTLGREEGAASAFTMSLVITEQLTQSEPSRVDYQRDLSVVYNEMGVLHQAFGRGAEAAAAFTKALAINQRLAQSEPGRVDYQFHLSVSYEMMGILYLALGRGDEAAAAVTKALEIAEQLAQSEPDRADDQRDLSLLYNKIGDRYRALGRGDEAAASFNKALTIRERLAQSEPDRADYQRDLSVSYERIGDLYLALGRREEAAGVFAKSLDIAERHAQREPGRADYQRDLSVSYSQMGNLYLSLGRGEDAVAAFDKDLAITERLAQCEPGRADYQHDLAISYTQLGQVCVNQGFMSEGKGYFQRSFGIAEKLLRTEPERVDFQRLRAWLLNQLASMERQASNQLG